MALPGQTWVLWPPAQPSLQWRSGTWLGLISSSLLLHSGVHQSFLLKTADYWVHKLLMGGAKINRNLEVASHESKMGSWKKENAKEWCVDRKGTPESGDNCRSLVKNLHSNDALILRESPSDKLHPTERLKWAGVWRPHMLILTVHAFCVCSKGNADIIFFYLSLNSSPRSRQWIQRVTK